MPQTRTKNTQNNSSASGKSKTRRILTRSITKNSVGVKIIENKSIEAEIFTFEAPFTEITVSFLKELYSKSKLYVQNMLNIIEDMRMQESSQLNFANLVLPILRADHVLDNISSYIELLQFCHCDSDIRDTCRQLYKRINAVVIEFQMNEDIHSLLTIYSRTFEAITLVGEERKAFEKIIDRNKRNGLDQSSEIREKIKLIKQEISELEIKYASNINESKDYVVLKRRQLKSFSRDFFARNECVDDSAKSALNYKYKIYLSSDDASDILNYCIDREARKQVYYGRYAIGGVENIRIVKELALLRAKLASLLGYKSYADYVARSKVVGSSRKIGAFLHKIDEAYDATYNQTKEEITQLARAHSEDECSPWDFDFYTSKWREKRGSVTTALSYQYFPVSFVIDKCFELFGDLFGIIISQEITDNRWHDKVTKYKVIDAKTGKDYGRFFLDIFARIGKHSHNEAFVLRLPVDGSAIGSPVDGHIPGSVVMLCNFEESETLSFSDVNTFFHEFGHVLHFLLCDAKLPVNHSCNVATDFLEAPSQLIEQWLKDKRVLSKITKHVTTGATMPERMMLELIREDPRDNALLQKWQLCMAGFDYELHNKTEDVLQDIDVNELFEEVCSRVLHRQKLQKPTQWAANFIHMSDTRYAGSYCAYLYSEVMAMDMFTRFKVDPLDPVIGMKYREHILSKGSRFGERQIMKGFLGREFNDGAFMRAAGSTSNEATNLRVLRGQKRGRTSDDNAGMELGKRVIISPI